MGFGKWLVCTNKFTFLAEKLYTSTIDQTPDSTATTKNINNSDQMPCEVQNAATKQILLCSHAPDTHYFGKLNYICSHCGSLSFMNELFRYCYNGKVH